jgi:hypothetical protein
MLLCDGADIKGAANVLLTGSFLLAVQSPELRTNARLRGPRYMSTEDAELAAMAAQPPFSAHPVG